MDPINDVLSWFAYEEGGAGVVSDLPFLSVGLGAGGQDEVDAGREVSGLRKKQKVNPGAVHFQVVPGGKALNEQADIRKP